MNRYKIQFLATTIVSFNLLSYAQTINFEFADPQPILEEFYGGSSTSADIDDDGDQDLLIIGFSDERAVLYTNDGVGNFTKVDPFPFPFPNGGDVDAVAIFEDFDGDEDFDLFYATTSGAQEIVHIYLNDGTGNFTQLNNPQLPQSSLVDAKAIDVDDDGDKDLVISTFDDVVANLSTNVYINDGNALFTPSEGSNFTPIRMGSIGGIDIENDGDIDLIISGQEDTSDSSAATKLYLNDGDGNFNIDTTQNFVALSADDINAADIDGDGDFDILTSGADTSSVPTTILYINNGEGQFTELTDTGFQNTFAGASNEIADFDNDGDLDILITGSQTGGLPNIFNIVYSNLGNNEFEEAQILGGDYIAETEVWDFDGDGLVDLLIQGFVNRTSFYWNASETLTIQDNNTQMSNIYVFPNPSTGFIQLSGLYGSQKFNLYNAIGERIIHGTIENNATIDINDLRAGIYFLRLETGRVMKILKK